MSERERVSERAKEGGREIGRELYKRKKQRRKYNKKNGNILNQIKESLEDPYYNEMISNFSLPSD